MDTVKYILKRLLLSVVILLGVALIIYALARLMPVDYFDSQYASALGQGTMKQADLDRIKAIYGLNMPDAYLDARIEGESEFAGRRFRRSVHEIEKVGDSVTFLAGWYAREDAQRSADENRNYSAVYSSGDYRLTLYMPQGAYASDGTALPEAEPRGTWMLGVVKDYGNSNSTAPEEGEEGGTESGGDMEFSGTVVEPIESGTFSMAEDLTITLVGEKGTYGLNVRFSLATFWDKTAAIIGGYFNWLWNLVRGNLGTSLKYKQPVSDVILGSMGISFGISFVATLLEFLIAIPLGIKAATNQYGFIDYTVTVLTMIGISLPTFFLGAIVLRLFGVDGLIPIFPTSGLVGGGSFMANWFVGLGDMLYHLVLPMFVLVILSVGSLMRYTRTNTLEVLNADYIRTARAKGLSEKSVIYKHAFRNTMIPLVTLMAGILPSLFGGAMITEQVFGIPGIGQKAYAALIVGDIPFIMAYNMFLAIMTVLGTLLSDLMYAIVDPRVKISK